MKIDKLKLLRLRKRLVNSILNNAFIFGFLSLVWFIIRTGMKPSRAVYPCQQAAATNGQIWLTTYIFPFLSMVPQKMSFFSGRKKAIIIVLALMAASTAASIAWWRSYKDEGEPQNYAETVAGFTLTGRRANVTLASDIFVVSNTSGNDDGVQMLIELMGNHDLLFYKSQKAGKNEGPTGLIAKDDVIIIKVNCQWDQRGGTNTDLVKSLIQVILNHPEGFTGEIIVADNGQTQHGPTGTGGSFTYNKNNAEDISQSIQKVVDTFSNSDKVSTYLWDTITLKQVKEYCEGDIEDGYIVNTTKNPRTGVMVSYPKFKTQFGTFVSFKMGIWDPVTKTYNSESLKVINVPVLKSHISYGVTACVKHYMGVVSDKLTAQLGARAHNRIRTGGMGTEMVETRFPTINIIDAIWVNSNPGEGPRTPYNKATRVNVIAASTDPAALDYWAAKNILIQAWSIRTNNGSSLMDPDNAEEGSFGHWLRLSTQEILKAGYQATVNENQMNVYVVSRAGE